MRFHETRYPDLYTEILNPWEQTCRYTKTSWKKKLTKQELNGPSTIFYWRDVELLKDLANIQQRENYFNKWQKSRLNFRTLPLWYGMGNRFIKIQKDFPAGYNFKHRPLSLAEVHAMDGKVMGHCHTLMQKRKMSHRIFKRQ